MVYVSINYNRIGERRASICVCILDSCRVFRYAPPKTRDGGVKRFNRHVTAIFGTIVAFPCGPNDFAIDDGRRPQIEPRHHQSNIFLIHSSQRCKCWTPSGIVSSCFDHINLFRPVRELSRGTFHEPRTGSEKDA